MPLTANFIADFSSFIQACADANTSTDQLVEAAGKVGRSLDEGVADVAGKVKQFGSDVASFAKSTWSVLSSDQMREFGSSVKEFATSYIEEFTESEAATSRLNSALQAAGQTAPGVAAAYEAMAGHLQDISTFSDEAITDSQTMFTTIGRVAPENMEKVLKAAMDLSVGLGKDLPYATKLMAEASASDGEKLGALKGILGDNIDKGAKFEDVLAAINKQFGGQAAAQMETTEGKLKNLNNQMSNFNETIGGVLAENLKRVMDLFKSLPDGVQTFIIAAVSLGTALAPILVSLSSLVSLVGGLVGTAGIAAIGTAIGAAIPPVLAIAAAIGALYLAWKYWDDIVAVAKSAANSIVGFLKYLWDGLTQTITLVKSFVTQIKDFMVGQLTGVVDSVLALPKKVIGGFKAMYDAVVGHSYVPDMIDGIEQHFARLDGAMVQPTVRAIAEMDRAWNNAHGLAHLYAGAGGSFPGYSPDRVLDYGWGTSAIMTPDAQSVAWGRGGGWGGAGTINVTVNMSGMFDTDDPQTRSRVASLVSDSVMQGMRNGRLLGTT